MSQEQTINDIAVKVGRLEEKQEASNRAIGDMAASVHRLIDKLDKSDDVAKEALQSVRSAHLRMNEFGKQMDDMKAGHRWAIGAGLSSIGLCLTAIGLLWKAIGN
ncbi:hypothetical protein AB4Z21_19340 [Paenibacillus sp. MCAF20]